MEELWWVSGKARLEYDDLGASVPRQNISTLIVDDIST